MTRILLFLATNAAVLVLISIVFRVLGIEGNLGIDLTSKVRIGVVHGAGTGLLRARR